ncbi:MAG TPA: tryptophan synthase subunit alpha [Candidatus Paceibacterota bacterium]|nr:tryptophan synthase subunit alpha [Verrucomicrobiota bacterium]HRY48308.1 tryptophan synthase subunit alpha [Candidatus Paceibacterota bacterium]HRZ99555.1 tryptophan synthase subunit alpha [Candidatus Paceibacterota bacterium]
MNRIQERFHQLENRHQKGLITYIGAGDPDLGATHDLAMAFDQAGVDVLELGVPFSDPLADGLTNQLAAQRGLDSGTTPAGVLETVAQIRRTSGIPIVLYLYYNLAARNGLDTFIRQASESGVDGMLMLDLPPEEGAQYRELMSQAGLCAIHLVAPTTPEDRIRYIVSQGSGFVYYVSREGVTGMQQEVAESIGERVALIRRHTDLPVAVGFGISTPAQAARVAEEADAVVVGSAIVNQIARFGRGPDLVPGATAFVRTLVDAVKNPGNRLAEPVPEQR